MIICSNCGATNNEANGSICRKCGALLPISNKHHRARITTKQKQKEVNKPPTKKKTPKPKPVQSQLQQIPLEPIIEEPKEQEEHNIVQDDDKEDILIGEEILQEIKPQPFKGSIIASKGVYGKKAQEDNIPEAQIVSDESVLVRQKQLEEDMTNVLKILSKKVSVESVEAKKPEKPKKLLEEKIPPSSMNDILQSLLKLDLHIEASAIIKKDGTILASAISSRISDSLFGTIGQNLSMIGNDIIQGLNAGNLLNISIRGSNGVLDLAPINTTGQDLGSDMLLIIFSHPKIKSGIIHFAANIVKKQVNEYLGLS